MCICIYLHMCIYLYTYVYMYVCMHLYIPEYINTAYSVHNVPCVCKFSGQR